MTLTDPHPPEPAGPPPHHPVDVVLLLTTQTGSCWRCVRARDADGLWNLPSGKLERDEDAISAVVRETREEIGLHLQPDEPRMIAAVHHRPVGGAARLGLVFAVRFDPGRQGEPVNAEPHKCAGVGWFSTDGVPANTYPYSTACITAVRDQQPLVLSGWP